MAEEIIEGSVMLEGTAGDLIGEPEPCRLRWTNHDDGRFEIAFLSGHSLSVPGGADRAVWVRFDDAESRTRLRIPAGVQARVLLLASAET